MTCRRPLVMEYVISCSSAIVTLHALRHHFQGSEILAGQQSTFGHVNVRCAQGGGSGAQQAHPGHGELIDDGC